MLVVLMLCLPGILSARTFSVSPGESIQSAVDQAQPGDTIELQAGTYQHGQVGADPQGPEDNRREFVIFSRSGTASQPITLTCAANQRCVLRGRGFVDADCLDPDPQKCSPDGKAHGPIGQTNEKLVDIQASYIVITNLEITNSNRWGVYVAGTHNRVEGVLAHNNWQAGIDVGGNHHVIRGNETRYSRRMSGIQAWPRPTFHDNWIEYNLTWNNGKEEFCHTGTGKPCKVLPFSGDNAGGGNSDGIGISKDCHDKAEQAGDDNYCKRNLVRHNVIWNNTDGGYDGNITDSTIAYNASIGNGFPGVGVVAYKVLRKITGCLDFVRNYAIGDKGRGFEFRQSCGQVVNNLALYSGSNGMYFQIPAGLEVKNNLGHLNTGNAYNNLNTPTREANASDDSTGDVRMDPKLINPGIWRQPDGNYHIPIPAGLTIRERGDWVFAELNKAMMASDGSPAIDAGVPVMVKNYQTGDTAPLPFEGQGPDTNAVEYTTGGPPIPPPNGPPPDTDPLPAAPQNVHFMGIQPGSATGTMALDVLWDAPTEDVNGDPVKAITGYLVCTDVQPIPDDRGNADCTPTLPTDTDVWVDCAGTAVCYVRVAAETSGGHGPLSEQQSVRLGEPGQYVIGVPR